MRFHSTEHVLESILNACCMHVGTMPDTTRCSVAHQYPPGSPRGHFHLIAARECLLIDEASQDRTHLLRGDLVIVLGDTRHILAVGVDDESVEGGLAAAIYGEFEFPMGSAGPVRRALPGCIVTRASEASQCYRELVEVLLAAAGSTRPGQRVVINKLASSLLALALCDFANRIPAPMEMFAALLDGRIARVLSAIHERPNEQWTIHALAALAGMSRSSFALHFAALMGTPPMRYVSTWKVVQAKQLLQDPRVSVAKVAELLGYSSEAAFRKLFKRVEGMGPGRARAVARNAGSAQGTEQGMVAAAPSIERTSDACCLENGCD